METLIPAVAGAVALLAAVAKSLMDGSGKKLDNLQADVTYIRGNGQQTRTDMQQMRSDLQGHARDDEQRFDRIFRELKAQRKEDS